MVTDSLRFPLRGDDTLRVLLIGGALSFFAFLVVPGIIVQGYLVRVLGAATRGDVDPPEFEDWGDLLLDGIKVIVVQLVYVAIPFIVLFFAMLFTVYGPGGEAPRDGLARGVGLFGGLLVFVAVLLFLVAAYLIPAALANFASHDDLGAAFDLSTVTDAALTVDYLVAVVLSAVVSLAIVLVSAPLVVVLVGFVVLFYGQVAVSHILGEGFADGLELQSSTPSAYRDY